MKQSSPTLGILAIQAWRLQAFLTLLVAILAILPPSVFAVLELSRVRQYAQGQASHIADMIRILAEERSMTFHALAPLIEHELGPSGMLSVDFIGGEGEKILHVGDGTSFLVSIELPMSINPAIGPLHELRFMVNDRRMLYHISRVVGIHLLVATILAFAIHKMGIQSLHRALKELAGMQEQLIHSEKLRAVGEIYAGLTHEINNPLGIILSRVELLQDAVKERRLPADFVRNLDVIHRQGSRIAETIRGLLAFARRTSLEMTDTDLNHVIDETVALVEKPFSERKIQIERQLSTGLPRIPASPSHLQQVLVNLLNNARDAMPQGGTINLRTYQDSDYLIAEVQDSGTGIAQEIKDKIFEPFFTTKEVGTGTGLGLSVSYGIMKAHGGDVEVENAHPKGALFRLSLPTGQGAI